MRTLSGIFPENVSFILSESTNVPSNVLVFSLSAAITPCSSRASITSITVKWSGTFLITPTGLEEDFGMDTTTFHFPIVFNCSMLSNCLTVYGNTKRSRPTLEVIVSPIFFFNKFAISLSSGRDKLRKDLLSFVMWTIAGGGCGTCRFLPLWIPSVGGDGVPSLT